MSKEKDKDKDAVEKEPEAVKETPKVMLPPPARFEVRTPIEAFTGKRGETTIRNKKTGQLERHDAVYIKNGVGWTDDELVAGECVRIGYNVTDHKKDAK
jgi:hypothetical protein